MKKIFSLAVSFILVVICLGAAPAAHAVDIISPGCSSSDATSTPGICQGNPSAKDSQNPIFGPTGIMTTVVRLLSIVIGVAAIIVIIIAGISMMVANGDANAVSTARRNILYALVGVAIAGVAQIIVAFVLNKL